MTRGISAALTSFLLIVFLFFFPGCDGYITTAERPSSSVAETVMSLDHTEAATEKGTDEGRPETAPSTTLPESDPSATETSEILPSGGFIRDVPYLSQLPRYPNGCEIVSTVMLLQYLEIDVSSEELITKYLKMGPLPKVNGIGPDPAEVFCGDPRKNNSWGCYAPVIVDALRRIPELAHFTVSSSESKTLDELCHEYIDLGYPVVVWGMLNTRPVSHPDLYAYWYTETGSTIRYNKNQHCLLLVGYDESRYYFHDPLVKGFGENGAIGYPKDAADEAFSIMGMQSVAILRKG